MLQRLVIALVVVSAGCNDTAIVLRVVSNRPAGQLDALCVELDAGGVEKFGRSYGLASSAAAPSGLALPQTLTVLPAGRAATQAIIYGSRRGQVVARARQDLTFKSGAVLHVDLPLDACVPQPSSARFIAASAPSGDTVEAAALVPATLTTPGDLAIAAAAGHSARATATASGLAPLTGGAPAAPAGRARQIVSADLDGDCRLDLVLVADGAPPSLWHAAADGGFTLLGPLGGVAALSVASGDVDGDGTVDLVAVGGTDAHVYLNDGSGRFREQPGALDLAPDDATAVALADLDGDGNLDLVLGQGSATPDVARVYLNDKAGTGHFTFAAGALPPKKARVSWLALGDLDGNHTVDVAMAQLGGAVRVYLNRGDAFLEDRSFTLLPDQVSADVPSLLLQDLNNDCLPDLIVARAGGAPLAWISAGGGRLADGAPLGGAVEATGALGDDVDGDGVPDLLLYGSTTGLQVELQR